MMLRTSDLQCVFSGPSDLPVDGSRPQLTVLGANKEMVMKVARRIKKIDMNRDDHLRGPTRGAVANRTALHAMSEMSHRAINVVELLLALAAQKLNAKCTQVYMQANSSLNPPVSSYS